MSSSRARRDPEGWLAELDPIGWRFGLERITALVDVLGDPQATFRSAHVVGTNGKSSVTAMLAALLEAHGHATGAYLSPHVRRWSERIRIRGQELDAEAFGASAERVAAAATAVEPGFAEGERVTQFEAATAIAFDAMARADVEFGVIEAGLGGRLDATNVLPSELTALTSVGLDHTEWLGETELEIAAEKLAVLRPGSVLVAGRLSPAVAALAERTAAERGARLIVAPEAAPGPSALAPYLRRNQGVALAAAEVLLGELDPAAAATALEHVRLPGRLQRIEGDPPVIFDAAHNPQGARALAEALAETETDRPVVACLAILADKDHEGIVEALAPALRAACCCAVPAAELAGSGRPGTTSTPASELARACDAAGIEARAFESPEEAVAAAAGLARGLGGVALLAGSHYLLRYEWIARRAQSFSR